MKFLSFTALIGSLLLVSCASVTAPKIPDENLTEEYSVIRTPTPNSSGEKIEIVKGKNAIYTVEPLDGLGSYYNLIADILFVDYGTSAGKRMMKLFDVAQKKEIFSTDYVGDFVVNKTFCTYDVLLTEKPDAEKCSNFEDIKKMGGSVNYLQKKSLDYSSLALTDIGTPFCSYGE